ncbi:hypothetical protein GQ42DRAFT_111316, partial [Ramicandelaber brevisporus]
SVNSRKQYTPDQVAVLLTIFEADRSPTVTDQMTIGEVLNIDQRNVKIWFQNRRQEQNNTERQTAE